MPNITIHNGVSEVEFRRTDESVWTWLERGLWELPTYRGKNTTIPGKSGQAARPRIADELLITAPTVIKAATESDLLALADEVNAVWEATQAQPRAMRIYGPLYGIPAGFYRTLNVRYLNAIIEWQTARIRAKYSVQYECVDSPPDWVQVAV